jgi:hypothetical protein
MGVYPRPFLQRIEPAAALTLKKITAASAPTARTERVSRAEINDDGR